LWRGEEEEEEEVMVVEAVLEGGRSTADYFGVRDSVACSYCRIWRRAEIDRRLAMKKKRWKNYHGRKGSFG
jgi:hypothetical protein